jgi:integrase
MLIIRANKTKAKKRKDILINIGVSYYTGMRSSELYECKLKEEDGVLYFQINDGKTANSNRNVPLHNHLREWLKAGHRAITDAIYPDLAAQYDTLLFPVYLAPILDGRSFADALKTFMQADGIHPNKAGVGLIVPVIGPYVVDLVGKIE